RHPPHEGLDPGARARRQRDRDQLASSTLGRRDLYASTHSQKWTEDRQRLARRGASHVCREARRELGGDLLSRHLMTGAFAYLLYHSFINSLRQRFLRLKKPKYLIVSLFVVGYLYMIFSRDSDGHTRSNAPSTSDFPIASAYALILSVIVAVAW